MEQTLSLAPPERPVVRIAFARLLQAIGWTGLVGLLLFVAAAIVAGNAWSFRVEALATRRTLVETPPAPPQPAVQLRDPVTQLPGRGEISTLLTRVERAAVSNGLPWTSAEYRFVPTSGKKAALLEVRCAFKAPYPKLRGMLADLIGSVPALTIREMNFSRQSIDSADVDAKLVIAIFLADDDSASASPVPR